MARLVEALEASPKVDTVLTNLHAGTIIVHHEEAALPDIKATLKDLGVILAAATGVGTSAKSLTDAVSRLDNHLASATKGILSLKLMVPLGFSALAILQLARRGLEITGAPWYLLAYFAFESFARLNSPEVESSPAESITEESADIM
jgi:hypothetical protein